MNQELNELNEMDANGTEQPVDSEPDYDRTVYIEISGLSLDEYIGVCEILKKRASFLAEGVSCKFSVTDDEGTDIRKRDNW